MAEPDITVVAAAAAAALDPDPRVTCLRCRHLEGSRCANRRRAGLLTAVIGPTLARLPQHCPGFAPRRGWEGA